MGWDAKDEDLNLRSVARARQRLGDLYVTQGRAREAMAQFQLMSSISEQLAAASQPDDLLAQTRLARSQRQLGFVAFQNMGDTDSAFRYLRRALEINRACRAIKDGDDTKLDLANTLGQLAAVELWLGHLETAGAYYRDEVALRELFSPARARNVLMRMELASLYEKLAELHLRMGDQGEGRQFYERCRLRREQILAEQPGQWPAEYGVARSFNNSGFLCYPYGNDPKAARGYHQRALNLIEKRALADPFNLETKSILAETLYYEATCALHSGDKAGAEAGYHRCMEIRKLLAIEPTAKLPQVHLMVVLARCGEHAEAARMAGSLIAIPPRNEQFYFQAACGYALAAGACNDSALARLYTGEAVTSLRKGKERGWADVVSLQTDPDLEPIRTDPAFRALVAEFRKPGEKRP